MANPYKKPRDSSLAYEKTFINQHRKISLKLASCTIELVNNLHHNLSQYRHLNNLIILI